MLDTGRAYYDVYRCADGEWVAVGALEPEFFAVLKAKMGLASSQHDAGLREELEAAFLSRPRRHWCDLLETCDACFAPVLSLADAPAHPHNAMRGTFLDVGGVVQPAPAPRFSAKD